MAEEKITVVLDYENQQCHWNVDQPFSALNQFVKDSFKLSNFDLEYDDDGEPMVIEDEDDLQEAFTYAKAQLVKQLKICVSTNETLEDTPMKVDIDIEIFHNKSSNCKKDFLCQCTKRIVIAMKYYQSLDLNNNNDKEKLLYFLNFIYTHIVNDFTHILTEHPDTLDEMYDFATKD
eukprot:485600_1